MKHLSRWLLLCCLLPVLGHAQGAPSDSLDVSVQLTMLDLLDIDDTEETITAEFILDLSWQTVSLRNRRLATAEMVVPKIEIRNLTNVQPFSQDEVTIDGRGRAHHSQRLIATLQHQFDFTAFPFDVQQWELVVFTLGRPAYRLLPDTSYAGLQEDFIDPPAWNVKFLGVHPTRLRGPGPDIEGLSYAFTLRRHSVYYVWKVLIPIGLIVFMSWGVFWIRPEEISAQLTVSVTAILTLVAFQFSVSQLVPPLAYLTVLDKFAIGADIFVFLAFVESIVTSYQAQYGRHLISARIDRTARWVFPLGFLFFVLWL